MKSKVFRWYERHERAVNAVIDIACNAIPGAGMVKGVINLAHSVDQDTEDIENDQRIQELEKMLATIKPQMSDLVEEIEELREFKEAKTSEDIRDVIYKNQHIVEELNEVMPVMSTSISQSISAFAALTQETEEKYETLLGGKYTLEHCLATGGQGTVYRGRNTVADREVAIKLLPKEFTSNTHGVEVLKAEYRRLVDKLAHTNIVQYRDLDFSQEKQQWFITMDYVNGHTLRKNIFENHQKAFSPKQVHKYLMPVAEALEYAHKNEVVHCDLKPENIMINRNGNILLTDFGLSQEVQQSVILSATKQVKEIGGTLPYMAPEQYKGWGVTKHTDVWSLGVIMYEMLAGRHPFQAITYEHYKDIICNEQPRPLDDQRVWYIVQQALHKNDRERVSSPLILVKQLLDTEKVSVQPVVDSQQVELQVKKNEEKIEQIDEGDELCKKGIEYREKLDIDKVSVQAVVDSKQVELQVKKNEEKIEQIDEGDELCKKGIEYRKKETPEGYKKALELFNKAAKLGNSTGMYHLGSMYKAGHGVDRDYNEAVKWYRQSAELGNSDGMIYLGSMYESGYGVVEDGSEAVKWYKKSAELGNSEAMCSLGEMYDDLFGGGSSGGVKKDDEEAVKWYRKSAELGNSSAMCYLGTKYVYVRHGVDENYNEAVKWYRKSAELGDAYGMYCLGTMYEDGHGVNKDYNEAVKWYRKSAELGYYNGEVGLGRIYKNGGYGVDKDYSEAVKWFEKTGKSYELGKIYENGGYGVDQDYNEALKWYNKSARSFNCRNRVEAMYSLGMMYQEGRGVVQDDVEAVKWFRKSAERLNESAMSSLGVMYLRGRGVMQDNVEAVKWFRKSAEKGDSNGMYNLGLMYQAGCGVVEDDVEAVKWYRKSAELGNENAIKMLKKLNKN